MTQPRVFITLGRTRQVVERGGTVSTSGKMHNGTGPRSGSKRSIGDKLGRYPNGSLVSSKRQRWDGTKWGRVDNGLDDRQLTRNDLRWKLWRRRLAKQNRLGEGKKMDLHKKLSKSGQPSASNNVLQLRPARQLAPMGGIMEKRSQVVEEPLSVSGLLHSLGLGKYEITFRAEEVDMMVLMQMGDKDLKDIGIPMGPRKKILLALNNNLHKFAT